MPKKNIEDKVEANIETADLDAQTDAAADNEAQQTEDTIRVAFTEALDGNAEEDDVKMAMIQAGATFKNVTRMYNQFMIDGGFAISKSDRDAIVESTLEGAELATEEGFDAAAAAIAEAVQGSTDRSAAALVRAYAKRMELEVYAKPKGTGTPRSGFVAGFHNWLVENNTATKEEALAYIQGEGVHAETSENVKRHASAHMNAWALVNAMTAKLG